MGPDLSSTFLIRLASLKFFSSFCSVGLRIVLSRPTGCLEQYCNVKETSASVFPSRMLLYFKTVYHFSLLVFLMFWLIAVVLIFRHTLTVVTMI